MENKELTFEEKMEKLEKLASKIQNNELDLAQMSAAIEEANALIKELTTTLEEAKEKVNTYKKV